MKWIAALLFIFYLSTAHASVTILFLGDSLTEGLGVDEEQAFPRVLEKQLNNSGYAVTIINGGVSGATSASGLTRLKWHLKKNINMIALELGANDGLRGLQIADTQKNLGEIIQLAQSRNIKILLLGLNMPPNYGKTYTDDFTQMYAGLASNYQIPLLSDLLKGVAGVADLNQPDGIHPNTKGHEMIAQHVFTFIAKQLPENQSAKNGSNPK